MRRTDLDGVSLDDYRARLAVLRRMTPEEKLREVDRLLEAKRAAERAYRATLFALPMLSHRVGRIIRIAPDDPSR